MKKNNNEFIVNKVPSIIVIICRTFSHHLLVIVHIQPHILVKFNETFLFCIKITIISNTEIIICVVVKIVSIFYFLENNIEYKIFKIVKIATAIIKFIVQFIINCIFGNLNTSFIVFDNNHKINQFIIKLTIGNMKKRGNQSSFNTGLTNVFNSHKIIHPSKYVFHAFIHSGNTTTASGWVSLFNKYQIINNIEAFNNIEKNIFITYKLVTKLYNFIFNFFSNSNISS